MAHNEIKYRARLVKDFAPTPPVAGNEGRLCQVFLNLLLNAAQSIEGGAAAENEIRVSTRAKKGYVVVEIADTGCGMDDETVGRIFEPFFTTKPPGVGSGLGLPICRNFVESHGGDISVESAPGRGSRFEIRIPVERKGIALADPSLAPRPPFEAPRRGRILLIDDEELVAKSIARVLGRDHEVVTAPSGAEGMNILTRDEGFDLVLCDVMMPTVSGMDVYEWLKERSPEIARRMVFVTGGVFTAEAVEFRESVPNPWIEKPIDPGRLRDLVGDLLDPGSGGSDAGGEPRR